ncbi:TetR/AcrR family transcriptional regulator [Gemmiger sp.]
MATIETRQAAVYEAALRLIGQGTSPSALKIQQLADAAGIGKGTVYEYFSSKEEILQGLAVYCFARENERIRAILADCATLADMQEKVAAYLQDIAANRMGDYKMIAESLGAPNCHGGMRARTDDLKVIVLDLLGRLQAAGEIDPALDAHYCCHAVFSAVAGGLMGLYYAHETGGDEAEVLRNLKVMLGRMLG